MLGLGGLIGADARRADHGASACPARTPRLVCAHGAEHRPVPRVVDLRADRDRHRRQRPVTAGVRIRRRGVLEGALRPRRNRPSRSSGRSVSCGRYVRKFAVWFVIASLLYLALVVAARPVPDPVSGISPGGHSFWLGFDFTLASLIISWTPLVADYTRFSRSKAAGFWGSGPRLLHPLHPALRAGGGDRTVAAHRRRARGC